MNYAMKLLVAKPRGVCAGVERAVAMVDRALALFGPPLYIRRQLVHNQATLERLRVAGAHFVEELDEVPDGARVVFAAHGVAPTVKEEAARRGLEVFDASCPLVEKVHAEVVRYRRQGFHLLLIGHRDHDEVVGTLAYGGEDITLVTDEEHARRVSLPVAPERALMALTQTTLSVVETAEIIAVLRGRFPRLQLPPKDDICYATQNRQDAVKALCDAGAELVLVVGSQNSSNSQRLVQSALERGVAAELIDGPDDLSAAWLLGRDVIGLSAGASTPEASVAAVIRRLQHLRPIEQEVVTTSDEATVFALPLALR